MTKSNDTIEPRALDSIDAQRTLNASGNAVKYIKFTANKSYCPLFGNQFDDKCLNSYHKCTFIIINLKHRRHGQHKQNIQWLLYPKIVHIVM